MPRPHERKALGDGLSETSHIKPTEILNPVLDTFERLNPVRNSEAILRIVDLHPNDDPDIVVGEAALEYYPPYTQLVYFLYWEGSIKKALWFAVDPTTALKGNAVVSSDPSVCVHGMYFIGSENWKYVATVRKNNHKAWRKWRYKDGTVFHTPANLDATNTSRLLKEEGERLRLLEKPTTNTVVIQEFKRTVEGVWEDWHPDDMPMYANIDLLEAQIIEEVKSFARTQEEPGTEMLLTLRKFKTNFDPSTKTAEVTWPVQVYRADNGEIWRNRFSRRAPYEDSRLTKITFYV